MKYSSGALVLFGLCVVLGACSHGPSPEQQKQIAVLQEQAAAVAKETVSAEADHAQYPGGLVGSLVEARLQVLKTNASLIQQGILALQTGAPVTARTYPTKPDEALAEKLESQITQQKIALAKAQAEAAGAGGLVQAMAMASAATQGQTLAMLEQRYLIAKYGIAYPTLPSNAGGAAAATTAKSSPPALAAKGAVADKPSVEDGIVKVTLEKKEFSKGDFESYIFFNLRYDATGLDKPARAIKGVLHLTDLFGESKVSVRMDINQPLAPGQSLEVKGTGFKYNQFEDSSTWARSTSLDDMRATFTVTNILYADGTRRDF